MGMSVEVIDQKHVRLALIVLLGGLAGGPALAQAPAQPPAQPPTPATQPSAQARPEMPRVVLTAGRSTVLASEFDITRIAITNPAVADAVVVAPREILIDGKTAGTISLILWGEGRRLQYDIVVQQPIPDLQQRLQALFPGEDIVVTFNEDATILSGTVSNTNVMLRAAEIARTSSNKRTVINMLQVPGGSESQQVLLQVRFAEVNRRVLRELGLNLIVNRTGWVARATTQQFTSPTIDDAQNPGGIVFSDLLNLFYFSREEGIGGIMRALQQTGAFQSLAEPNLIAYNGQEASFLAGGEFPVPVAQGATGAVTVTFKEFGIRLTFTPTIAGDVIRLKVAPEVSALDFANGVSLGGFRIPALTTRRAQTDVELRDGQSFAIAGLLDNVSQEDDAAIPFLSKIPIIGTIFKSKADRANQTELMVLITPRLVRPLDPDEVPPLPTRFKPFLGGPGGSGGVGQGFEGTGMVDAPEGEKPKQKTEKKPSGR